MSERTTAPDSPGTVSLSLVSHTNAGKTTLARTLLGRDVGLVRDAPHVTEFAEAYEMLRTPEGDVLRLWDTPGFGDSLRLARRLRQSGQPIGWLLSEVWDRWRDRPFWSSQQAVRNVRDEADVVLYLVNASESPQAAGYVKPEMEVLAWIAKPVVVLLNQLGAPRDDADEAADLARWREHLAGCPNVSALLPLDAFARCWVQESALLQAIENALSGEPRARMRRLARAWMATRLHSFEASAGVLAHSLARAAGAGVALPTQGSLAGSLRRLGSGLGALAGGRRDAPEIQAAVQTLEAQWREDLRRSTDALIELHDLRGHAQAQTLERLTDQTALRRRVDEGKAAAWGGVVSGALAGLKADLASGGLTLGGGMLAGGLLGALGAAGVARGVNLVRGTQQSWLSWKPEALDAMFEAALLRYLAVAHFGRGRGDWEATAAPARWSDAVQAARLEHSEAIDALWSARRAGPATAPAEPHLEAQLQPLLCASMRSVLERLYPEAVWPEPDGAGAGSA